MKSKTKNNKVPKSAKTKLSDLTPQKDARAGKYGAPGHVPGQTPPIFDPPPSASSPVKKHVTL